MNLGTEAVPQLERAIGILIPAKAYRLLSKKTCLVMLTKLELAAKAVKKGDNSDSRLVVELSFATQSTPFGYVHRNGLVSIAHMVELENCRYLTEVKDSI